jgi:hypothetical protein
MRKCLRVVAVGLFACVGCDNQTEPSAKFDDVPAATTQAAQTTSPVAHRDGPLKNIPLGLVPFTADVPDSWAVQSGLANRIVLHGTLESGDVDVLLSRQPDLKADAFNSFIAQQRAASTQPAKESTHVLSRENMTIVETVDKPLEGLVTYNVTYFVTGPTLDYEVYVLSIGDLTQDMYDNDGELLRKVLLGLKYDPKATELPR